MRAAVVLALLTYVLAASVTGPRWLARARWVARAPKTAIAAWLALTVSVLTAVLEAAVLAELPMLPMSLRPGPLSYSLAQSLQMQFSTPEGAAAGAAAALLLCIVVGRIGWQVTRTWATAKSRRARHVQGLVVVGRPGPSADSLVVDDERAAVYCVPGQGQIVVTTGALNRLDPRQLDAVLGHERAHLMGRHHLVVTFTAALAAAFPRMRLFTVAAREVSQLVEMAADDAGSRRADKLTLANALFALAAAPVPVSALAASGSGTAQRIRRLLEPLHAASPAERAAITMTRCASVTAITLALTAAPTAAVLAGCCWSNL
jgi:Zn-dependent protease with chaperone function